MEKTLINDHLNLQKTECFDISFYDVISVWDKPVDEKIARKYPRIEDDVLLITDKVKTIKNKPAVIICPGGGYEHLSVEKEGIKIIEALKNTDYQAFVLTYRVGHNLYPKAHLDLAKALKYIKDNAETYGIDPLNVMILGFSAGGHLCASFATVYKEMEELLYKTLKKESMLKETDEIVSLKPSKVALCYPVISLIEEYHKGSAEYLTDNDIKLSEKLSVDLHISKDYPKTFLWANNDDASVPVSNTIRMGKALENNGIDYKIEIFPSGGHGCGLAKDTSAASWMEKLLEFMNS